MMGASASATKSYAMRTGQAGDAELLQAEEGQINLIALRDAKVAAEQTALIDEAHLRRQAEQSLSALEQSFVRYTWQMLTGNYIGKAIKAKRTFPFSLAAKFLGVQELFSEQKLNT